jgi:hypothetical protein
LRIADKGRRFNTHTWPLERVGGEYPPSY